MPKGQVGSQVFFGALKRRIHILFFVFVFVFQEEDVSEKSKEEICQILEKHGMMKSEVARDEVPEEPEDEPEETYEEEGTWGEGQETGDEEEEEEEPEDEEGTEGPGIEEHEDEFDAPEHIEL